MKIHDKMTKLQISQCFICNEAWPNISGNLCTICKRDKIQPTKFSAQNNMIPSAVPEDLTVLTQIEEMLISTAFPLMNVYCKPRGG